MFTIYDFAMLLKAVALVRAALCFLFVMTWSNKLSSAVRQRSANDGSDSLWTQGNGTLGKRHRDGICADCIYSYGARLQRLFFCVSNASQSDRATSKLEYFGATWLYKNDWSWGPVTTAAGPAVPGRHSQLSAKKCNRRGRPHIL